MTNEKQFYNRTGEWLDRLLELNPVAATWLGDHRWDDQLPDYGLDALESQHQETLEALDDFRAMDVRDFALDAQIDHTLMVKILESFVREYEGIQSHLTNPGRYLEDVLDGIFALIVRDFAPLPERLRSALGRVRQVPRALEEGRANLVAEAVPPVWIELALEQARQAPGLFMSLLPGLAQQALPALGDDLTEAGHAAAEAIGTYAAYVENELQPQVAGDFAIGTALFNDKLREEHLVSYDAQELLEIGWEQFHQTEQQMETLVEQIAPGRSVNEVLTGAKDDHPTAEGLLGAYREAMAAARNYVVEHNIVSIPQGESLRIIETPPYLRPVFPYAAYMQPGILEEQQEGIFLVTPVDPDAPREQREQHLRGHSRAKLPITALHEAYPGHHLQLVWANRQEHVARRMSSFLSPLFIEGWAFYCEELMEKLGYIDAPIQRLGRLSDQRWRAARIILDVSLHTRGMTVDEGVHFLVQKCGLEADHARAEVRRYTTSPTQPQSYLMGKLAILDLVDDHRQVHPQASLQETHDAIMSCGSLPPSLMRQRLLGW
jgi:uncharacterized protein (DUF885 family)